MKAQAVIKNGEVTYMNESVDTTVDTILPIDVTLDENAVLPEQAHLGDAGMDLVASEDVVLPAFKPVLVPTGIKMAIPFGYEGQVRPRSGLSLKGVTVWNSPGTIDALFRGEIKVILMYIPHPERGITYEIKKGDRIAQLVVAKCEQVQLNPVLFLDETVRGEGGFGSSGK